MGIVRDCYFIVSFITDSLKEIWILKIVFKKQMLKQKLNYIYQAFQNHLGSVTYMKTAIQLFY